VLLVFQINHFLFRGQQTAILNAPTDILIIMWQVFAQAATLGVPPVRIQVTLIVPLAHQATSSSRLYALLAVQIICMATYHSAYARIARVHVCYAAARE
jgi:hypothetical protein